MQMSALPGLVDLLELWLCIQQEENRLGRYCFPLASAYACAEAAGKDHYAIQRDLDRLQREWRRYYWPQQRSQELAAAALPQLPSLEKQITDNWEGGGSGGGRGTGGRIGKQTGSVPFTGPTAGPGASILSAASPARGAATVRAPLRLALPLGLRSRAAAAASASAANPAGTQCPLPLVLAATLRRTGGSVREAERTPAMLGTASAATLQLGLTRSGGRGSPSPLSAYSPAGHAPNADWSFTAAAYPYTLPVLGQEEYRGRAVPSRAATSSPELGVPAPSKRTAQTALGPPRHRAC
ncbi:uncharacterized protein LOC135182142 [Pogoniulus pusillus]|uniref:uncharacterized protein LOC135182142 n=1 Tax=Pogoniulus pusillus TaxID=488313 RepID=UPI0030B93F42